MDPVVVFNFRVSNAATYNEMAAPIRLHHNTIVNLCTLSNEFTPDTGLPSALSSALDAEAFSDVVEESNLIHAPVNGHNTYAPMFAAARPDADYIGYSEDLSVAPLPNAGATPPGSIAVYYPVEGSSALGSGDPDINASLSLKVLRDFDGNLRPFPASIGAFETL